MQLLASLPSLTAPLKSFGCTLTESFPGTLFRLALRTPSQSQTSRLSNQSHDVATVTALLAAAAAASQSLLLFLKSVENIEIYHWPADAPQPILMHSTGIVNPTPALRERRSFVIKAKFDPDAANTNDYAIEMSSTSTPPAASPDSNSTWIVCNQLGASNPQSPCTVLALDPTLSHMKLVPFAGVAYCLSTPLSLTDSHAYTFLPLPVSPNLPVHLNGYFELSSNRRDLWSGADMSGDGALRAAWNESLLTDIIAPCYARLIQHCIKQGGGTNPDTYHHLFPTAPAPLFEPLVKALYDIVTPLPVLYSGNMDQFISPSVAVLPADSSDAALLEILATEPTLPLVLLPKDSDLSATLLRYAAVPETRLTTPPYVRSFYARVVTTGADCGDDCYNDAPPSLSSPHPTFSRLTTLLLYCTTDLTPSTYSSLHNLPFIPLANGRTGRFSLLTTVDDVKCEQLTMMGFSPLQSQHALRR